jgi:hypothetical protein
VTDTPQPTSGALTARIIRACPKHPDCPLDCPERNVEELGEVARFERAGSFIQKIREMLSP